jgi:hypothetical protein
MVGSHAAFAREVLIDKLKVGLVKPVEATIT